MLASTQQRPSGRSRSACAYSASGSGTAAPGWRICTGPLWQPPGGAGARARLPAGTSRRWPQRAALSMSAAAAACAAVRRRNAVARSKASPTGRPQVRLVVVVPGQFPGPAARPQGVQRRLGHRLPGPGRDRPVVGAGPAGLRADEASVIGLVAHPVADKAQAAHGALDGPAAGRGLPGQHGVVGVGVVAHQRGVDDRDLPDHLADHGERPGLVPGPGAGEPLGRLVHGRDGPLERAGPGRRVARLLAVPRDPAARRAEPGVLAARRERRSALVAVPDVSRHDHHGRYPRPARPAQPGRRARPRGAGARPRRRGRAR